MCTIQQMIMVKLESIWPTTTVCKRVSALYPNWYHRPCTRSISMNWVNWMKIDWIQLWILTKQKKIERISESFSNGKNWTLVTVFPRNNDDDDKNLGNSIKNNPNRLIRYDSAQLNKDYSNENFQIFFFLIVS